MRESVIALWEAETLQPSEVNRADLRIAYRTLDQGGCAAASSDTVTENCPLVHKDICEAKVRLESRSEQSGLPEEASRFRRLAQDAACR